MDFDWIRWDFSAEWARFEVILLDQANIALKPTNQPDQFPYWDAWPIEPEQYLSGTPNVVTLHMWAPCVKCHFIPVWEGSIYPENNSSLLREQYRQNCVILVHHQELSTDVLDSLNGMSYDELASRADYLGTILHSEEDANIKQHRHIHEMAVFPKPSDCCPDLMLLRKDPRDPQIVFREELVSVSEQALNGVYSGVRKKRSALDIGIGQYVKYRYIRMQ